MFLGVLVLTSLALETVAISSELVFPHVDSTCFRKARVGFCSTHSPDSWTRCLEDIGQPQDLIYVNKTSLCHAGLKHLCIVEDFCPIRPNFELPKQSSKVDIARPQDDAEPLNSTDLLTKHQSTTPAHHQGQLEREQKKPMEGKKQSVPSSVGDNPKKLAAVVEKQKKLRADAERNKKLQAEVEKQKRLRAEAERTKKLQEEAEKLRKLRTQAAEHERQKKLKLEAQARAQAEAEARAKAANDELQRRLQLEAQAQAEAEAKAKAANDERQRKLKLEAQARAQAQAQAEAEAKAKAANDERQRKLELEAQARAQAEAKAKAKAAHDERQRKLKLEAQAQAKTRVEAEQKQKTEAAKLERQRKLKQEARAQAKAQVEVEQKKKKVEAAEAERKKKVEAAEAEQKQKAEAAEAERKQKAEAAELEQRKVDARRRMHLQQAEERRRRDEADAEHFRFVAEHDDQRQFMTSTNSNENLDEMATETFNETYLDYPFPSQSSETEAISFGWYAMAAMVCLLGLMLIVTASALCTAGVKRGQDRMLQQLRATLVDARVIEPNRQATSARRTRRRQATELNQMNPISEEPGQEVLPPTVPTRTYSLRYLTQRPSLANMKRRMSSVFGGANLIDFNNEGPVQNSSGPLRPEEEGDWV